MLQVNNLILPVGGDEALLRQTAAKALRVPQASSSPSPSTASPSTPGGKPTSAWSAPSASP